MKRMSKILSLVLVLCMIIPILPAASAYDTNLPSLYKTFKDYFMIGTFGEWSGAQAQKHYIINAPANNLKLDSQIGTSATNSVSRQSYVAAVNAINANEALSAEEKAAAIDAANKNVELVASPAVISTLNSIRTANLSRAEGDKIKVRGHVFVWHGGQQPNYFFCNGFTYNAANPDWASPEVMLARLDNYIKKMTQRYSVYNDIIVSFDVVNEAIDDYSGQIRNATDYQPGQWGRIFRRADLDGDPDARLYAESVFVRQAFASARKWSNEYGAGWKLYYNDFQDSNKLYDPKMSANIKMLKPIYEAGNIDGFGMQARLASAYPDIELLKKHILMNLTVADEVSFSEHDIRSDFEPNPFYNPEQPTRRVVAGDTPQWVANDPNSGSGSVANISAAGGNTFDAHNSPVRRIPAWGTGASALATNADVMKKQADYAAELYDFLLEHHDKIAAICWDGTSDSNTFNSNKGAHIWDSSGNEKYSFFAILGSVPRYELKNLIADIKENPAKYVQSDALSAAIASAESILDVKIYNMAAVNDVYAAKSALESAAMLVSEMPCGDNFIAGTKNGTWSIVNNDPNGWSLDKAKGLRLPTQRFDIYGDSTGVEYKNIFLQPAPGDWDVVAKFHYPKAPSANYQQGALVVWQDDENYIKVECEYAYTGSIRMQAGLETGGSFTGTLMNNDLPPAGDGSLTVYYRVKKAGNAYNASYSLDGVNYTAVGGTMTAALTNPKIGVYATKNTEITEESPVIDTYCEYVSVLASGGEVHMTPQDMMHNAVEAVLKYVAAEVPTTTKESFKLAAVPHGYTVTGLSDSVGTITNDGVVTQSEVQKEIVNYTVTVSDGVSSASEAIAITVPKLSVAPTSDSFVAGNKDSKWTVLRENTATYSVDKGLGLRLPTQRYEIGSANAWENCFVRPAGGDWEAVAKVFYPVAPSAGYQQIAFLAFQDDMNFIKVDHEYNGGQRTKAAACRSGAATEIGNMGAAGSLTANTDGSLTGYFKIKKVGDVFTCSFSKDGLTYTQIGNPVTYVMDDPQLGLFATRNNTSAEINAYCEYITVTEIDGVQIRPYDMMLLEAVSNVGMYVLADIPAVIKEDIVFSPVPHGYTVTLESSDESVISNTGKIGPNAAGKSVDLTVRVSDATASTTGTVKVTVEGEPTPPNPMTGDNFVAGRMDDQWTIIRPETETYSLDKGLGLRLVAKKEAISGTAEVDKEWRNVVARPAYGDYEVVAKTYFPLAPSTNYQQSALLVYQDEDNYIKVDAERNGRNVIAQFFVETDGVFSGTRIDALAPASDGSLTVYYRIVKTGNTYVGSYSLDGITYKNIGNPITRTYADPKIALYATKHTQTNEPLINTYFEYVSVLSKDGTVIMTPEEMLNEAFEKVVEYVSEEIPAVLSSDLSIRVPYGYVLSYSCSEPGVISSTGAVTRGAAEKDVVLTVNITNGTRIASHEVGVKIPKADPKVTVSVGTLVAGRAANLPFTVSFTDLTGLKATLFGKTVDVVDGAGLFAFTAAQVPAAGVYALTITNGEDLVASAAVEVVAEPVGLWAPVINSGDTKFSVIFGAPISFNEAKKSVKIGSDPALDSSLYVINGNTLAVSAPVASGQKVVISGIKYADLFPSYSFSFTVTAP